MIKSKFIATVEVIDPDTNLPVTVEIRKLETGGMIGIDGSYLEQEVGPVYSPFDRNEQVEIPEDE